MTMPSSSSSPRPARGSGKAKESAGADATAAASERGLFDTDRPGGLHQRVYRSLAHAIGSGRFDRGERLPSESELASTFAVSRPVVRQALQILRREGLIESQRGSGNYVRGDDRGVPGASTAPYSPIQIRNLLDDLEFRQVMEPAAAFLAARRRTAADLKRMEEAMLRFEEAQAIGAITHHFDFLFHEAIALATTNARFVEAVRALEYRPGDTRLQMRDHLLFLPSQRATALLREHGEVLSLIRLRDAEGARAAMWKHIDAARLRLTDHMTAASRSPTAALPAEPTP